MPVADDDGTPRLEVESAGIIDDRDSAYPQAAVLGNGDVLCSYSNAGGPSALGGTDLARSLDGGRTWTFDGTLLSPGTDPPTTNFLKLSKASDRATVYAYGARLGPTTAARFGERTSEPIFCWSEDDGHTWSGPRVVPIPGARHEISHGVLALRGGRLLAPAASVESGRRGERVVAAVSNDAGMTWPERVVVFEDPAGELGFFEHKLTDLGGGHILATSWTVRMADVMDLPNRYAVSHDHGATWSPPRLTDLHGQTLSTVGLGGDWLLALFNRRHRDPAIVVALVSLVGDEWATHTEMALFRPRARSVDNDGGVDRFGAFQFGFPTAIRLPDGAVLATFWARDGERCAVRWARLLLSSSTRGSDESLPA
jgi:hypothetical protein